ncbi:MAG TPA: hypothetical protein VGN57_15675 [Pirellulaceae bacterium]|jgi:hypothetical protein|nr:hypothetical protein [Pirellulaceae bacterium]
MNRRDWMALGCAGVAFVALAVGWRLLQPYFYGYFRPSHYELQVQNASSADLEDIAVEYVGSKRRETFGDLTPGGEASIFGLREAIPDQMFVTWADADGERRESTVEVASILDIDLSVRFKTPQIVIVFEDHQEPRAVLEFLPF